MKNLEIQYFSDAQGKWVPSAAMVSVRAFKTLSPWKRWTKELRGEHMRYRLVRTKPFKVIYTPR